MLGKKNLENITKNKMRWLQYFYKFELIKNMTSFEFSV